MKGTNVITGAFVFVCVVLIALFLTQKSTKTIDVSVPGNSASPTITQEKTMKQYEKPPELHIDTKKSYTVDIKTSKGDMKIILFTKESPKTVNNFVFLAQKGFYNKTKFHRIIKGFMIQGGDPIGNGTGGPGYIFDDEPITREYKRGTIAMANRGPNTNGSQFFIMHADYPLDKNYVIFGEIEASDNASLSTLDAIASVPVARSASGESSVPQEAITVESVTIQEK